MRGERERGEGACPASGSSRAPIMQMHSDFAGPTDFGAPLSGPTLFIAPSFARPAESMDGAGLGAQTSMHGAVRLP